MSFDIVNTLEIPQGATELTTSQLKQISGGHQGQENGNNRKNRKKNNNRKNRKNQDGCDNRKNSNNCDNNNDNN